MSERLAGGTLLDAGGLLSPVAGWGCMGELLVRSGVREGVRVGEGEREER